MEVAPEVVFPTEVAVVWCEVDCCSEIGEPDVGCRCIEEEDEEEEEEEEWRVVMMLLCLCLWLFGLMREDLF